MKLVASEQQRENKENEHLSWFINNTTAIIGSVLMDRQDNLGSCQLVSAKTDRVVLSKMEISYPYSGSCGLCRKEILPPCRLVLPLVWRQQNWTVCLSCVSVAPSVYTCCSEQLLQPSRTGRRCGGKQQLQDRSCSVTGYRMQISRKSGKTLCIYWKAVKEIDALLFIQLCIQGLCNLPG